MPFRSMAPWLAGAFLLLLGFHLWLAFGLPGPILYEDTMGYLAIARSLAGWQPEPALNAPHGVYHFGYPLLLAPLYLVLESTWRVFQAARVLDSVLASLQVVLLYVLGHGVFGLGRGFALGAALAAALYPAWMLQSSFVWTESLFAFLFSLWVLLAWESLRRRTGPWPLAFGLIGAFLYTVHPRGLGLVAVTLAALLLWAVRGLVDRRQAAAGIVAAAALFAGTRLLNAWFLKKLWVTPPLPDERFVLGHLLDPAVWLGALPARVAGQIWYLQAATLGVFGIGVAGLVLLAWRGRTNEGDRQEAARTWVAGLILLGGAAVLSASATVMLPAFRSDHLVYGRYNESLLGLFLVAGLAGLRGTRGRRLAALAGSAAVLALLGLLLPRVLPANLLAEQPMPLNVLGVLPWNPWATLELGATTLRALGALGLLALVAVASRRAAVAGLALCFVISTLVSGRLLAPWCQAVRGVVTLQEVIRPLSPTSLSYERSGLSTFGFNGYQLWLDRVTFHLFDAAAGEQPADDLVIAPRSWSAPGFRLIAVEAGMDQALWVRPGPLQEDLGRRGWLIPADPAAPLPDSAVRSRIERLNGDGPVLLESDGTASLRFRVEHAGQGAPWMPAGSLASPWGSVRLGGQWLREGNPTPVASFPLRSELPRVLRPGEAVEVGMEVAARDPGGAPLAPGSYTLEIALVQEGVRWFPQAGDNSLPIPVEVRP